MNISFLLLLLQITINQMAWTTQSYYLTVLQVRSPDVSVHYNQSNWQCFFGRMWQRMWFLPIHHRWAVFTSPRLLDWCSSLLAPRNSCILCFLPFSSIFKARMMNQQFFKLHLSDALFFCGFPKKIMWLDWVHLDNLG